MQKVQKIFIWKLLVCKMNLKKQNNKFKEKLRFVQLLSKKIKAKNNKSTDSKKKSNKFFKTLNK